MKYITLFLNRLLVSQLLQLLQLLKLLEILEHINLNKYIPSDGMYEILQMDYDICVLILLNFINELFRNLILTYKTLWDNMVP